MGDIVEMDERRLSNIGVSYERSMIERLTRVEPRHAHMFKYTYDKCNEIVNLSNFMMTTVVRLSGSILSYLLYETYKFQRMCSPNVLTLISNSINVLASLSKTFGKILLT